jgi:hypothetical protein
MSLPIAPLPPLSASTFPSKQWFYHSLLPTHTYTLQVAQLLQTGNPNDLNLYRYKEIAPQVIKNIITTRYWLQNESSKCTTRWNVALPMIQHFETTSLNLAAFIAEDSECIEEIVQQVGEDELRTLLEEYLLDLLKANGNMFSIKIA